ncbi:hypothetical protein L208DRAFT_1333081 [Tricholoma matsutake]|nr:hypothetical protein L208DRAFT_1333081 [Tricholoma matsutake 945]
MHNKSDGSGGVDGSIAYELGWSGNSAVGNPAAPQFSNFDTSSSDDNLVVMQYLDGITQNPLVINSDKNMTSDMRIFSSDSNTTVCSMVSPAVHSSTCQSILERVINLVPGNVTLTPPIMLLPVKVQDVQLTFEQNMLVFKASLHLLQEIGAPINMNCTVMMLWCNKHGGTTNCNGVTRSILPASTVNEGPTFLP